MFKMTIGGNGSDRNNLTIFGNVIMSFFIVFFISVIIFLCVGIFYGLNYYWLWSARMGGEQELARAEGNRKIVILEAVAKKDSAKSLADAEIIRAEGLAKANKIIGDSLKQNESYLKYLWIQSLDKTQNKVIYVPTEANLPILEAQRLQMEDRE